MHSSILLLLLITISVTGRVLPRDDGPPDPGCSTVRDPGLQDVPDEAQLPNTFNNGESQNNLGLPWGTGSIPDLYQTREIDIPFGRMFHGNISFFGYGQYGGDDNTATWLPNITDFANQRYFFVLHSDAMKL